MFTAPDVPVVRDLKPGDFDGTPFERTQLLVDCLREQGIDVPNPRPGQDHVGCSMAKGCPNPAAFKAATEGCNQVIPPLPPMAESARNYSVLYDALLGMAQCVRTFGVTPPEPPTRETYVDARLRGETGWLPYINGSNDDPVYEACHPLQFMKEPFDRGPDE